MRISLSHQKYISRTASSSISKSIYSTDTSRRNNDRTGSPESLSRSVTKFQVWDVFAGKKVNLTTRRPNIVNWYSCGPTVYDSAHIGHASSYIRQDVIRRLIEKLDGEISVVQVMGITDVDDKIIKKSKESNVAPKAITEKYEDEFIDDLLRLGVKLPHIRTRVTVFVPQILKFVMHLVSADLAYATNDGSVYFDTNKYGRYGKLRKPEAENIIGEPEDSQKKDPKDFALWKGWKEGEMFWTSPWGKGRPGWHIECSVMASHFFGTNVDIHTGGMDLLFPHHENEEAQCCARFGLQNWVSHWFHTGHLHFKEDAKMSKSLGNTISISKFLEAYSSDVFRMFCIMSNYRSHLEYSEETIIYARNVLSKFTTFLDDCTSIMNGVKRVKSVPGSDIVLWQKLLESRAQIHALLLDDFNTPSVIKILIEYTSLFNKNIVPTVSNQENGITEYGLVLSSQDLMLSFLNLVGIQDSLGPRNFHQPAVGNNVNSVVNELVEFRSKVRDYSLAFAETDKAVRKKKMENRKQLTEECDRVRDRLDLFGIEIKDHGPNSSWTFKKE